MSKLLKSTLLLATTSTLIKPLPPNFADILQIKTISNDTWNKIPSSYYHIDFYDKQKSTDKIGTITYRAGVGQIGIFYINPQYRNKGYGKQILLQAINEMRKYNTSHIWAVTSKNHLFWSNVFNKSFEWYNAGKLHPSVRGYGYKMRIPYDEN